MQETARSFDVSGAWVRWSRYELLDGRLRPADGAELIRYDPWSDFRSNEGKYRTVHQPYQRLLQLGHDLAAAEAKGAQISIGRFSGAQNEMDRLILDWCNENGLLGLLPTFGHTIRLPFQKISLRRGRKSQQALKQTIYKRSGGSWRAEELVLLTTWATSEDPRLRVRPLGPGYIWFDWQTQRYEDLVLEQLEDFFDQPIDSSPSRKPMAFIPPRPGTAEFWTHYRESHIQVYLSTQRFMEAVDALAKFDGEADPGAPTIADAGAAHYTLSALAEIAAPAFRFSPEIGRVEEVRESPGLLATYALMFMWDRIERRRILRCQNCDCYFVSNEHRARYCTPTCRNTAQSRRYRSRAEAT
jgi:hypothetical protein